MSVERRTWKGKRLNVFTTGQIAAILSVAPRTVTKWIDKGMLQGYRLPDSQDRRVTREVLVEFMKDWAIPLSGLERFDHECMNTEV